MTNVELILGDIDAEEAVLHDDPCCCPVGSAEAVPADDSG